MHWTLSPPTLPSVSFDSLELVASLFQLLPWLPEARVKNDACRLAKGPLISNHGQRFWALSPQGGAFQPCG